MVAILPILANRGQNSPSGGEGEVIMAAQQAPGKAGLLTAHCLLLTIIIPTKPTVRD
jgi:hypothetical protein